MEKEPEKAAVELRHKLITAIPAALVVIMVIATIVILVTQPNDAWSGGNDTDSEIAAGGADPAAVDSAEATGEATAPGVWWVANSALTECISTGGPSEMLRSMVGSADRPFTHDITDSNGSLVKVEVVDPDLDGTGATWTYYKSKTTCEAEAINYTENLADRYKYQ